uniref:Uncharacterized protein n=1 Tax=Globodera rostochiensis TaxID=31243 RepID=A0A914H2G2_GLORO
MVSASSGGTDTRTVILALKVRLCHDDVLALCKDAELPDENGNLDEGVNLQLTGKLSVLNSSGAGKEET